MANRIVSSKRTILPLLLFGLFLGGLFLSGLLLGGLLLGRLLLHGLLFCLLLGHRKFLLTEPNAWLICHWHRAESIGKTDHPKLGPSQLVNRDKPDVSTC